MKLLVIDVEYSCWLLILKLGMDFPRYLIPGHLVDRRLLTFGVVTVVL